ncbi:uncharacterized protein LAESUDRAFT_688458 [Laetiporus sulphureus 93-53]|uniref:6-phosphogluconate dehydrogenase C-terminal domain-like protein n=1 Tax=Laetiporus sulphureus 93-53 TaxID=1314785 RepID=A0A165B461_9APHY|nr:uncharacterized protein LAESUDRAFT_688458 [Laetiporus sulphureus 93-53]KZT00188.1 hypothetical protein LAESUDRAFT_688458 [Laetiporus sulphureus 93-53]
MTSHYKDVLLVGFGAVGAIYSLILKRSGLARITAVARSNYDAVNAHGLNIKSRKYGELQGWKPDRLFRSVAQALDRPYSYVVITTKAIPELIRTSTLLEPLLQPEYADKYLQPTYVLMQNGLNVEVDLYHALKKLNTSEEPRIISTAVWIGTGMLNSNTVEHSEFDRVSLGIYRPTTNNTENTPEETAILEDFAHILAAGGTETTVVPEIQRVKYSKNFWNACLGITAALTRFPLTAVFRPPHLAPGASQTAPPAPEPTNPNQEPQTPSAAATADIPSASPAISTYAIPLLYDAMSEVYALGMVLFPPSESGPPGLDPDIVRKTLVNTSRLHARPEANHRASTLVDVENGRPTEVEVILGELVRMGRREGVPMPRIETFYALMLIIQNQLLQQKKASL